MQKEETCGNRGETTPVHAGAMRKSLLFSLTL